MAKLTLVEFLNNRTQLAIKISSSDLPGVVRKSIRVPFHTAGLARFEDGSCTLFEEGQEVAGRFELVLAKRGEIPLRMSFADLRTKDGYPLAASVTLRVALSAARVDLFRDFSRVLFNFPGSYSAADLKNHLAPELRRMLQEYAAARPASELHEADLKEPLGSLVHRGMERFRFDAGVVGEGLTDLSLSSAEFERRASAEKKAADEARRSVEVLARKEERLKRLAGILKDQDVQGVLSKVPDERLKGLLYAKLMEDDNLQLTAEDLVHRAKDCGEEVVQVIYKAMETLLSSGASVMPEEVESSTADRIYLATGSRVLEVVPESEEKPRVYPFKDPLRSVRYLDTPDGPFLLGGSKRKVATVALGNHLELLEYPLPEGRAVRGGVNSMARSGQALFATHSEFGLARWRADEPSEPAELVYEEITRSHKTTRAVDVVDGKLLFASGHHVYLARPEAEEPPVKFVSSIESPVTCVDSAERTIFAGTENGSIVCWKQEAPDQPVVLVRKRDPIVNLRLAKICGIPHLIYSAKDLSVRARVIGQNLETSYESDGASIGVLDAASDLICASDAHGHRVLLWKATAPSHPLREIDVWKESEKPVLDIWMKKVRAKSA